MVHRICKAYTKHWWGVDKKKKIGTCCHCLWWGTFVFAFWFSFCVLYLLWIYLFWAELEVDLWHWSTLFIETTHTYTHAHPLCSEQKQCKSDRFFSLPPDELWLLNLSTWWPKVIDRYWLNMQGFLVDVFQLWRCHSIFSCCLHYSLHSAIFLSWNK